MLDADLAELYGVSTKAFNQAVRRNRERFPGDFLFELTNQEVARLRSQIVTLKTGRGEHRKYRPLAFTEHVLARELATLKSRVDTLDTDTRSQFEQVYEAILGLMNPAVKKQ